MNRYGKLSIAVSLVIAAAVLLVVSFSALAGKAAPGKQAAAPKLRMGITSIYTKNKLSVPVLRVDDRPYMPVIRITENISGSDPARPSAIKIVPYLTAKGEVKVDVSLLFGDLSSITSCEQYKKLKEQAVASYVSRKGAKMEITRLRAFGVTPIVLSFDEEEGGEQKYPPACDGCTCGTLCCKPNPGQCMGCGGCGQCCRM